MVTPTWWFVELDLLCAKSIHSYVHVGASPDAYVYESTDQYRLTEIKCPYKYQNISPVDAAKD